MAEIVTKWLAGWNFGKSIIVVEAQSRKTAKLLILESGDQDALQAGGYHRHFDHDDRRLHATKEAALNYLMAEEEKKITEAQANIDKAQVNIRKIIELKEAEVWQRRRQASNRPSSDLASCGRH